MQKHANGNGSENGTTLKNGNGAGTKDAVARRVPSVAQVAAFLGIVIGQALSKRVIQMFLKPLPAMSALMDDVASQLEIDASTLGLEDLKPADMLAMKATLPEQVVDVLRYVISGRLPG